MPSLTPLISNLRRRRRISIFSKLRVPLAISQTCQIILSFWIYSPKVPHSYVLGWFFSFFFKVSVEKHPMETILFKHLLTQVEFRNTFICVCFHGTESEQETMMLCHLHVGLLAFDAPISSPWLRQQKLPKIHNKPPLTLLITEEETASKARYYWLSH